MIPGVTDKQRLPRLGKIRLGEKATAASGKQYPRALDHFNFLEVPEVEQVYGPECREIFPIIFPAEEEETFFPTARKAYRKSGLFCACSDGETAHRVRVEEDKQGTEWLAGVGQSVAVGEMFEMPCAGEDCFYMAGGFCKNLGRLLFMIPNVPRFGVYEISTTSFNSVVNVLNVVRAVRNLTGGRIAGIPFALKLSPLQVQPEGKAKTVYVLELEFRGTIQTLASMGRKLIGGGPMALIDAGDVLPDDLYPQAGAALEAKLGGAPAPRPQTLNDRLKAAPPASGGAIAPPPAKPAEVEADDLPNDLPFDDPTQAAAQVPAAKPAPARATATKVNGGKRPLGW